MRAQKADLGVRRTDQHGLVFVESCVKESERPRHEFVRAGVQQRGMSSWLYADLCQVAHPLPFPGL